MRQMSHTSSGTSSAKEIEIRTFLAIVVAMLLVGCVSDQTTKRLPTDILGPGSFYVSMPSVCTNRPHLHLMDCGIIRIQTVPNYEPTSWDTLISCPFGSTEVTVSGTNGHAIASFSMWSDGTNAYLSLNGRAWPSGRQEYRVEKATNGITRLKEIME